MRRTVHVGQEVNQVFDQQQYGRIVHALVLAILHPVDRFFYGHQRIAWEVAFRIFEILVDRNAMVEPFVRVAAFGNVAEVVHP